jgi:hypothetical protein
MLVKATTAVQQPAADESSTIVQSGEADAGLFVPAVATP